MLHWRSRGLVLTAFFGAAAAHATPYFVEATSRLGPQPCAGTGCYTNYVLLADLDGDGDLDIVLPSANGYFTKAQPAQPLVLLRNDGAANFTDASSAFAGGLSGWVREVAAGDIDSDGDLDLFAPDAWGGPDALLINDGKGTFTNEIAQRLSSSHSRAGSARFADVDADGDLDLLVGDWGTNPPQGAWSVHLFLNSGTGTFTPADARLPSTAGADGTGPVDLDLVDADGDFDLDLLIDAHNGNAQLWLNDGSGTFTDASAQLANQPSGLHYNPAVCDVDGDGDLDVWIDNGATGMNEQLLINSGNGTFTDQTAIRVTGNSSGADDNGLACLDVDGDGDLDVAIASLSANERILLNDGTGHFTASADAFPTVRDSTLGFDFGDLDGDGRLDAVTGQGESGSFVNRLYLGTAAAPIDARPPVFRAVEGVGSRSIGAAATVRFAVRDNAVTDTGPRLSAVEVELTPPGGTLQTVKATFMGGDLFRAVLPAQAIAGTVGWRACATDRRGNRACTSPASYQVSGGAPGPDGGPGASDADAGAPDAGAPDAGAPDAGAPDAGASDAGSFAGTTLDAGQGGPNTPSPPAGCSCASLSEVLAALALALAWRRRARFSPR
jgi:hypothetical protein